MPRRSGKVEKKYARTLFELSAPEDRDRRGAGLAEWLGLLAELPQLQQAAENPAIPEGERLSMLAEVAERCSPGDELLKNFVLELAAHRRLGALAAILAAYQQLVQESRGVLAVEVISAFPLDEQERDNLRRDMEKSLGKRVEVQWSVDEHILGGLIVKAGDTVLDNSLQGALQRVRRQLRA